jgi:hypothetical protein
LDTVLPSAGSYQVSAQAGQFSLDECSVIAAEDRILPYFISPVVNDPDLSSLVLHVEDGAGKILGRRVSYTADPALIPAPLTNQNQAGNAEGEGLDETSGFEPDLTEELTIPVGNFAGKLPLFPLPEQLEAGSYTLIFEIRGRQDLLARIRRPFYYLGDREFTTGDIRCYLPGLYGSSHLVPQGSTVMLEIQVDYDKGLDPYIVWYNGKVRIGEGAVSGGAARLLWTAPAQSGFHRIRAELFPAEPQAGLKGRVKEFSLPISQVDKKADPALKPEDCLYWYRFAGDLLDARTGEELSLEGGSPSWYPAEQVYGLALEHGEIYEASRCSLDLSEDGEGDLAFFIRFLSLKDGRIFAARLGASLGIGLSLAEGDLILDLEGQGQRARTVKALPLSGKKAVFTGALIRVKLRKAGVSASLALVPLTAEGGWEASLAVGEGPEEDAGKAEINLNEALGGELRSWLGEARSEGTNRPEASGLVEPMEGLRDETDSSGESSILPPLEPVLVVDDLAALFRTYGGGTADD